MDQVKIGAFLKRLRIERNMTQEGAAERLNVSSRTISRWETGSNMPDIGILVEIAEFYDVSIPEIINGERKSEEMNKETKETAVAMAEYSRHEVKNGKRMIGGILLTFFGLFLMISPPIVFPSESSWGGNYAILGSLFFIVGIYGIISVIIAKKLKRLLIILACIIFLFGTFMLSDYVAVKHFGQVPRFSYSVSYNSCYPDRLVHKTLFFTVIQENPGTEGERVYISSHT